MIILHSPFSLFSCHTECKTAKSLLIAVQYESITVDFLFALAKKDTEKNFYVEIKSDKVRILEIALQNFFK